MVRISKVCVTAKACGLSERDIEMALALILATIYASNRGIPFDLVMTKANGILSSLEDDASEN